MEATLYTGDETLEVVGESNYQEALWKIVGAHRGDRVRYDAPAVLLPEPDNRFDTSAIKVLIDGHLVGYLSRQDAVAYGPGLLALMNQSANGLVALDATIVGGGQRSDGPGFLGVFIDHDPADFGIKPARAGDAPGFRTGLSEAVATDLADDGYDLSWYRELSDNDITAIRKLRHLLETDPDPIVRVDRIRLHAEQLPLAPTFAMPSPIRGPRLLRITRRRNSVFRCSSRPILLRPACGIRG